MKKLIFTLLMTVALVYGQSLDYDPNVEQTHTDVVVLNQKTTACASTNNLTTFYAQNNGQSGIMFDITATNCVTVQCFETNIDPGPRTVEIYWRAGTHVGFETTPAAWTFIGSVGLMGAGINAVTAIPIAVNVVIPACSTYAFYITCSSGTAMNYTNGTGVGNPLATDANIILREGTGKAYPFSTNFTPRQFNGTVFYNTGCVAGCAPMGINDLQLHAHQYIGKVNLEWQTNNTEDGVFVLYRSDDGSTYDQIHSSVDEFEHTDYRPINNSAYYRVEKLLSNGSSLQSETVQINAYNTFWSYYDGSTVWMSIQTPYNVYNSIGQLIVSGEGTSISTSVCTPGVYLIAPQGYEPFRIVVK